MIRFALDLLMAIPKTWLYTFEDGAKVSHLGGEPDFFFADVPGPSYDEDRDRALRAHWMSFLERDEVPSCIRSALLGVKVEVSA